MNLSRLKFGSTIAYIFRDRRTLTFKLSCIVIRSIFTDTDLLKKLISIILL